MLIGVGEGEGKAAFLYFNTDFPPQKEIAATSFALKGNFWGDARGNLSELPTYFVAHVRFTQLQIAIKCSKTDLYVICWPTTGRGKEHFYSFYWVHCLFSL